MATAKEAWSVKSLNETPGRRNRRFIFKTFAQRVGDIEIDVFRSLQPVKAEPSTGSSFFLDCLDQWRELNTAKDFISFYNDVKLLVHTLPMIMLHKELILSNLLSRLHMVARLSLEPILRLIAELSRDLLEDFLPFLPRICESLLCLLKEGADREPEIIEQIFTSWSCIFMYLQKYLTADIVHVLKVTIELRYYPKDFIQEFMSEATSFLLRNAPIKELIGGVRKIILEVGRRPSEVRKFGAITTLWQVMRGTASKFHSRADQEIHYLPSLSENTGSNVVAEVLSGSLQKLCADMDSKELMLVWDCLCQEITDCINDGSSLHLTRLLSVLTSTASFDRGRKVSNYAPMLELVEQLVRKFITPSMIGNGVDQSYDVADSILQLMLCVLDGLHSSNNWATIENVALQWASVFELRNERVLSFMGDLLKKDPSILNIFRTYILSACKNFIQEAEAEVIYLMLMLCERLQIRPGSLGIFHDLSEEVVVGIRQFARAKIHFWIRVINDKLDEDNWALLWGIISCWPYVMDAQKDASILLDLVYTLDLMLKMDSGDISASRRQIWQSLMGAALSSYGKLDIYEGVGDGERKEITHKFLDLAKQYKSSSQIISSVAHVLDAMYGSESEANTSFDIQCPELGEAKLVDAVDIFVDNLCHANKEIRISTLRILRHYKPLPGLDDPGLKHEDLKAHTLDSQSGNVLQLLLLIEETPISVVTSRRLTLLVSKIQTAISVGKIPEFYHLLVLNGIIGVLYNQFMDLSMSAIECLSVLLKKTKQYKHGVRKTGKKGKAHKYKTGENDEVDVGNSIGKDETDEGMMSEIDEDDEDGVSEKEEEDEGKLSGKEEDGGKVTEKDVDDMVWDRFISILHDCQSSFLESNDVDSTDAEPSTDLQGMCLPTVTLTRLQKMFHAFSFRKSCSKRCSSILSQLLHALQKVPAVAASHSHQIVPLFLKFLGYNVDTTFSSVDSFDLHVSSTKNWKVVLVEWLCLLRLLKNPGAIYQCQVVKDVLLKRLLDANDAEVQMKVLDILLNWKLSFLVPYGSHLKNLVSSESFRNELLAWNLSKESSAIAEGHRKDLVPVITRLLIPKVRNLKSLASRKILTLIASIVSLQSVCHQQVSKSSRKAVLGFIGQLDVAELPLFFILLVKPLQWFEKSSYTAAQWLWASPESGAFEVQAVDFLKFFTMENILTLPWKKICGFLHVVEDILAVFSEHHVRSFLDFLSGCVVRILGSCSCGLLYIRSDEYSKIAGHSGDTVPIGDKGDGAVSRIKSDFTVKQLKELRSLCLKILYAMLNKYDDHGFASEFWDEFFTAVMPLIKGFKLESSSSEKPTSLFSCFLAMSRSHNLVSLLCREGNLIPDIFSVLSATSASDDVLIGVLKFVDNLLSLGIELENESDRVKKIIAPHIETLVCNLHMLFHDVHQKKSRMSTGPDIIYNLLCLFMAHSPRKIVKHPGELILRVLKLLSMFIKEDMLAKKFVDILLPLVKVGPETSDVCMLVLQILRDVIPVLGGEMKTSILSALGPLLAFAEADMRSSICDLVGALAETDASILPLANLLGQLNATSAAEMENLDYDTILGAYDSIDMQYFSNLEVDHALVILSHCIHDMSSDELILRQCACGLLRSFVDFCASVCSQDIEDKELSDQMMETDETGWTKTCVQRIVNKFFFKHMGSAFAQGSTARKEWIDLLREMILKLSMFPALGLLKPLSSQDEDVDFFKNLTHLQKHRRARALMRFTNIFKRESIPEIPMKKVFVPLFFRMLFEVPQGKEEHIRNACMGALASLAGQMDWRSYRSMLLRCFEDMRKRPEMQKVLVRLVCSILDEFHFFVNPPLSGEGADLNDVETGISGGLLLNASANNGTPSISNDIKSFLIKVVLPKLQKLLALDSDKINVNVNVAVVKVLKLLPGDVMESQLPSVIHRIANFLKNRLESTRDEARSALAACLKELGIRYLQFVLKILKTTLKRGYELHVLGFSVNFILSKGINNPSGGELDCCLDDLLNVVECDILGDVAEEKEVEKIASKMKETRKSMSFDTLRLIAQNVTFKTHALKLLSPLSPYLEKQHLTSKVKVKVQNMLNHIATGVEHNPSADQTDLFIFIYSLIHDRTADMTCKQDASSAFQANGHMNERINIGDHAGFESPHANMITVFALNILHSRLKNIKIDYGDVLLLSMLDPFVNLLIACLNSKYEEVLAAALKSVSLLMKLPLPSLKSQADKLKTTLLDIAQNSGNATNPMMQSCLKLLTELLRSSKITLSVEQLRILMQFSAFVDLERNPSIVALSLLKAIVRRKLIAPEIYDIVVRVAELMVTSLEDSIRKRCSEIFLQFLLNYRLSGKRMQQHFNFLITYLRQVYEHATGRETVLEMIRVIIQKFPQRFLDEQSEILFIELVRRLANDPHKGVRSLIAIAIKLLIRHISPHSVDVLLKCSLAWYMGKDQLLWSTAAQFDLTLVVDNNEQLQVLGLFVEVMQKKFRECISTVLLMKTPEEEKSRIKMIVQAAADPLVNEKQPLLNEPPPYWKEAYYSLVFFEKILEQFPELCFEKFLEDLWEAIAELLMHRHCWVCTISSRLVALYFSQLSVQGKPLGATYLTKPSKLFMLAVSHCCQLRSNISAEAGIAEKVTSDVMQSNLVFTIYSIHASAEKAESRDPHTFWSTLTPQEQNSIFKACHLLNGRKGRELINLFTMGIKNQADQANNHDPFNLLLASLLESMGKIALEMVGIQTKTVLHSFKLIASRIGQDSCQLYAAEMLRPVYKICEGYAGKIFPDDVKQLAEEIRDSIQEILGTQGFVQAYSQIKNQLKSKREKRKREEKIMAVVNPERNAKRKLKMVAKHRANKKRKVMAMKMTRWMR
ncbi:Small subunit processome component 20-like protein [Drosera capensis]